MNNATKNYNILAISLSVLYHYFNIVRQNYFSDLSSFKILDLSAKPWIYIFL